MLHSNSAHSVPSSLSSRRHAPQTFGRCDSPWLILKGCPPVPESVDDEPEGNDDLASTRLVLVPMNLPSAARWVSLTSVGTVKACGTIHVGRPCMRPASWYLRELPPRCPVRRVQRADNSICMSNVDFADYSKSFVTQLRSSKSKLARTCRL